MAQSPITENSNLSTCVILSNGSEIQNQFYDQLIEIRIEKGINKVSEAEIILRDGDAADQNFMITDSGFFAPGAEITIQLGYEGHNETVFIGLVTKISIMIDDLDGSRLIVICNDKAIKATVTKKNAIFLNMTDSAIIEQIAQSWGLQTDVSSTSVQNKDMVQFYVSDWSFMVTRAEINGMVIITDNGKLTMSTPSVSDNSALSITYGYDLHEFDCELDATYQFSGVQGNSWDMSSQNIINASAETPNSNKQGNISASNLAAVLDVGTANINSGTDLEMDSLQAWSNATLLKSNLSRFKGTVLFQGSALANPNSLITLNGLSSRFNGDAYVSRVVHKFDSSGWMTEAGIGMSEKWYTESSGNINPNASGLLPGVKGLQTGIVKKIDQDPDNEFRVEVKIPILGDDSQSVWARLSSFYVGNSFGAYFMPEINDEVVLGFMNDDPRFPIILGSLYSTAIPSPITPDDTNSIKTIITSSLLQIKFDDKNKVITILTPGGNSIVLSDLDKGILLTDQNNNTIQLNDKGISINSQSDINISATNGISIQGTTISMSGTESISGSAGTVSLTGDEATSITGSGECTVSSDGELSIHGAMVMIN